MKNKKGFTLIELLAVIAIIAVLAILIVPNVLGKYNNAKEETFKVQIGNVLRAAQMQKQSDLLAGNDYTVYCFGSNICSSDNSLSVTESDIKYVVVFNSSGVVSSIAIEDNNYCYVSTSDVSNINKSNFIRGAKLNCTGSSCECIVPENSSSNNNNSNTNNGGSNTSQPTATAYKYWSSPQQDSTFTAYASNQKPATTFDSPSETGAVENMQTTPYAYIRTSMNEGAPSGHAACIHLGNKDYCVSPNISNSDLESSMSSALGRNDGSCSLKNNKYTCSYAIDETTCSSGTGMQCTLGRANGINCFVTTWGDVACSDGLNSNGCVVYNDGEATCFADGGLNRVTFKDPSSGSGSGGGSGVVTPGAGTAVYWSYAQGRVDNQYNSYSSTSKPATTYQFLNALASTSELSPYNSFQYIKTITDTNGNPTSHQACLYYEGKNLCLEANYWTLNASFTKTKLESAMSSAFSSELLDTDSIRCSITSDNNTVICILPNSDRCEVNSSGEAKCKAGLNGSSSDIWCRVDSSSTASCIPYSATTMPDPNDPPTSTY